MNCNFYKIEKELFIDDIMQKNPYKLFVLIFSLESNFNINILNNTFLIKKNIKKNFSNDNNTIFLFINLQKYTIKDNKYSQFITKDSIPYISFYFSGKHLARILSGEYDVFETTYNKIKNELSEHFELAKKQIVQPENNKQEEHSEKEDQEPKPDNMENLTDQIRQQRKLEEIEKLKQQYLINELTKLKRAKEIQEKLES